MIHFHIVTLFPEAIAPYLESSILGRAQKSRHIKISYYNPREYTDDKWKRVDRKPYGGGPGMVIEPEAMLRAIEKATKGVRGAIVLFFSPGGEQFTGAHAEKYAQKKHVVLICGRYEGVDARVARITGALPISVGPYVLTGGELPAATVIDTIARFVPGVLGDENSLEEKRHSTHFSKGEQQKASASHDVYTRPEVFVWKKKKYSVPKVLLSGDHAAIEQWRQQKSDTQVRKQKV